MGKASWIAQIRIWPQKISTKNVQITTFSNLRQNNVNYDTDADSTPGADSTTGADSITGADSTTGADRTTGANSTNGSDSTTGAVKMVLKPSVASADIAREACIC